MIIEKQVRKLTSKGKLTRSSKAATVTLAAPVAFQSGGGTGFKQDRAKKQRKMRNAGQRGEIHPEGENGGQRGNAATFDMRVRNLPPCNNMMNYEQL